MRVKCAGSVPNAPVVHTPVHTSKGHVQYGLEAGRLASVILIIGPGAIGEIRGVTEFEMPPGPQIARAIAAHSSALKRSSHHA